MMNNVLIKKGLIVFSTALAVVACAGRDEQVAHISGPGAAETQPPEQQRQQADMLEIDAEARLSAPAMESTADRSLQAVASYAKQGGVQNFMAVSAPPEPYIDPVYGQNRENYAAIDANPVRVVTEHPVSTLSIDVDTGAYANVRRFLNSGTLPPQDAVRVEELVNYFSYDYPVPAVGEAPFNVVTEVAPAPWDADALLMQIGIKGFEVPAARRAPANLVFLVDVSGSMQSADKLPLLKDALRMLTEQLNDRDRVAMVVYAGASGVVLEPTAGDNHDTILSALERLRAGGSTNGAAGIRLAYDTARASFVEGGVNRVILATDGDFNV
ncbi:MAG: von Willebrand factor type A domain-containing protein, partial [Pseudomonadota bacterium]